MKIIGIAATTAIDSEGQHFTSEAIEDMADGAVGKQICLNFDRSRAMGVIRKASVRDGRLEIEAFISDSVADLVRGAPFIVPGGTTMAPLSDPNTIDQFVIREFAMTASPQDSTLPPVQIV